VLEAFSERDEAPPSSARDFVERARLYAPALHRRIDRDQPAVVVALVRNQGDVPPPGATSETVYRGRVGVEWGD
jgi:hypothetical protein